MESITTATRRVAGIAGLAAALATAPLAPAAAQLSLDTELAAFSAMVWRGVTTTNRPVLEPTVALTAAARGTDLTLGLWSNAEPLHYDRASMLDSYAGAGGPLFSMHEAWVEAAREVRGATVAVGASAYVYPRAGDLSAYNTVELRTSVTLADALATTLAVNWDVGPVGGGYLELSGSRDVEVRGRALSLAAAAGWSAGQGAGDDPDALAYFARDGFTHVEGSVATAIELGRVTLSPSLHLAFAHDAWTREVAPDRERRVKGWVGTTVSWSRLLRGAEPAEAARVSDR